MAHNLTMCVSLDTSVELTRSSYSAAAHENEKLILENRFLRKQLKTRCLDNPQPSSCGPKIRSIEVIPGKGKVKKKLVNDGASKAKISTHLDEPASIPGKKILSKESNISFPDTLINVFALAERVSAMVLQTLQRHDILFPRQGRVHRHVRHAHSASNYSDASDESVAIRNSPRPSRQIIDDIHTSAKYGVRYSEEVEREFLPLPQCHHSTVQMHGIINSVPCSPARNNSADNRARSRSRSRSGQRIDKRKPPRSSIMAINTNEDPRSYSEILKKARTDITLTELGIDKTKIRHSITSDVLIEVFGKDNPAKADRLASNLINVMPEIRIRRPEKYGDLRVFGFDGLVKLNNIMATMAHFGECDPGMLNVGRIIPTNRLFSTPVRCPLGIAIKIARYEKIQLECPFPRWFF